MGRLEESERATALWLRTVRGAWRSSAQQLRHNVLPIRCDLLAQRPRVDPCARQGLRCHLPPLEPHQLLREGRRLLRVVDHFKAAGLWDDRLIAWQHTQLINRSVLAYLAVSERRILTEWPPRRCGLHRPPRNALVRDILQRHRVSSHAAFVWRRWPLRPRGRRRALNGTNFTGEKLSERLCSKNVGHTLRCELKSRSGLALGPLGAPEYESRVSSRSRVPLTTFFLQV